MEAAGFANDIAIERVLQKTRAILSKYHRPKKTKFKVASPI